MSGFPVIELFGPTIQGEGALIGTRTHFVRFGYCDFKCVWCDSLHSVLPKEVRDRATYLDANGIMDALSALPPSRWVTLSGGNPAMHKLDGVVSALQDKYKVAVETQGTLWKPWLGYVDLLTISPKPPSAGMGDTMPQTELFIRAAKNYLPDSDICIKIVIITDEDYAYAKKVFALPQVVGSKIQCVLQVGNPTPPTLESHQIPLSKRAMLLLLEKLAAMALNDRDMIDVLVLPQLHVLMWGNEENR